MRKKLIILLILLFIFSVVGFISLGGQIRDALSPKVTVIEISDELYGNKYYTKIPIGAVKTDGKNIFVYSVAQTDKYPEKSNIAVRCPIVILEQTDSCVYIQIGYLGNYRSVIIDSDKPISDGERVVVEERV